MQFDCLYVIFLQQLAQDLSGKMLQRGIKWYGKILLCQCMGPLH